MRRAEDYNSFTPNKNVSQTKEPIPMTVAELIAARRPDWKALEDLLDSFAKPRYERTPEDIERFSNLYRVVSADLALAESHQFPSEVVEYLNELVARAHSRLYRRRRSKWVDLGRFLLIDSPRWIVSDPMFWTAFALFWIPFFVCMAKCKYDPQFAVDAFPQVVAIETMYIDKIDADPIDRIPMVTWYAYHNGTIGFACFCFSCAGCLPGLYILLGNAIVLGAVFGYMISSEVAPNTTLHFLEFTTAHSSFELTAIVMSAAAGLRIGFGLIRTQGYSRLDSMRRAAVHATPMLALTFILFCLAGSIEALISPCDMSWTTFGLSDSVFFKRVVRAVTAGLLLVYFFGLGGIPVLKNWLAEQKARRANNNTIAQREEKYDERS